MSDQKNANRFVCQGKVGFQSPTLARQAAGRRAGREFYRCAACGLYHVGNRMQRAVHKQRKRRSTHGEA